MKWALLAVECNLLISLSHPFWDFVRLFWLQLKEETSVHGSDEEIDDQPEAGSDDDLSDDVDRHDPEEVKIY